MPVNLVELLLDERYSLLRFPPIGFELRLAGTPQSDATNSLPGEMGPHPGQPRQPVLQLRQLDLKPSLMRLCAPREDIEDQRRAIDYQDIELPLEIALLRRRQLAIDHHQVVLELRPKVLDLLELAFADIGPRMRMPKLLRDRTDNLDFHRLGEPSQLNERVRRAPGLPRSFDRDQKRLLRSGLGRGVPDFPRLFRLKRFVELIDFELVQVIEIFRLVGVIESLGF